MADAVAKDGETTPGKGKPKDDRKHAPPQRDLPPPPPRIEEPFEPVERGSLRVSDPMTLAFKGALLDRVPAYNFSDATLPPHAWMFCYPSGVYFEKRKQGEDPPTPKTFPYVLTAENGIRLYGSVLRFYEPMEEEQVKAVRALFRPKKKKVKHKKSFIASLRLKSARPRSASVVDGVTDATKPAATTAPPAATSDAAAVPTGEEAKTAVEGTRRHSTGSAPATVDGTPEREHAMVEEAQGEEGEGEEHNKERGQAEDEEEEEDEEDHQPQEDDAPGEAPSGDAAAVYYKPLCLCVLSRYPFLCTFREWLCELYRQVQAAGGSIAIERHIAHLVHEVPLPPPGGPKIKFTIGQRVLTLARPPDTYLPLAEVPFHYIFDCLDVHQFLRLFACLLTEQKLVFHSSQYSLLTLVAEGLVALMYPFRWQHVYVPVLPESLLEFVYSPTPFIIGLPSGFVAAASDTLAQVEELVLVDLDNNHVAAPPAVPPLPAKEAGRLRAALHALLHRDVFDCDAHYVRAAKDPSSSPKYPSKSYLGQLSMDQLNDRIRHAVHYFFVELFGSYRQFLIYLRVFPEPISVFDKKAFLRRRGDTADDAFLRQFLDCQGFTAFLEEHDSPFPNLFDDWIDAGRPAPSVDEDHSPAQHDVFTVPRPDPKPPSLVKYSRFPKLDPALLEVSRSLRPPEDRKRSPSTPRSSSASYVAPNPMPAPAPRPAAAKEPPSCAEDQQFFEGLLDKLFSASASGTAVNLDTATLGQMHDKFKSERGRAGFARALAAKKPASGRLSDDAFGALSDIMRGLIQEAHLQNDYESPQALVEAAFFYHRIKAGLQDFVHTRLKNQDLWLNRRFWEHFLYDEVRRAFAAHYPGDMRAHILRWQTLTAEEQQKAVAAEENVLFERLAAFAYNMLTLGSAEMTRRFVHQMCTLLDLSREKTLVLGELVSNMTRANEQSESDDLLVDDPADAAGTPGSSSWGLSGSSAAAAGTRTARKRPGEESDFLAIRSFSRQASDEQELGKSLLQSLLEGNRRITHRFKKKRARDLDGDGGQQKVESEERDDYIVKTFRGHAEGVLCVASTANVRVSGSCDATVRLWNAFSTECIEVLRGHTGWVVGLALDDDAKRAVSASYDCSLKLWDLAKAQKIRTLRGHTAPVSCMAHAHGFVVSGSADTTLRCWDARSKKPVKLLAGHSGPVLCLDAVFDRNMVVSGSRDNSLKVWDLRMGKPLHSFAAHNDWVKCCALAVCPKLAPEAPSLVCLSGSCDRQLRVFNLSTGAVVATLRGHTGTVNQLFYDPRSEQIVSSGADATIRVWEFNKEKEQDTPLRCAATLKGHTDEVVACAPFNGKLVSASYDAMIKIWDVQSKKAIRNLDGHTHRVCCLKVIEEHSLLLSGSWDASLKAWEFPLDWKG